jgi:ABC-type Mn2+/Zn2+ transport system ATPase subunit
MLLNRYLIADGPPTEVFTPDRIRQTFGGSVLIFEDTLVTNGSANR